MRPPTPTEESYDLYINEKHAILQSLNRRATRVRDALNAMEGVSCTDIAGALYGKKDMYIFIILQ